MQSRWLAPISASILALLASACGDDSSGSGGSSSESTSETGATDAAATTATGSVTGGGGAGGGAVDPDDIPAEPLGGDPAELCPGDFATTPPVAGDNQGFDVGAQSRDFYLILPDASFTGPRPLFFAFNGTGESGESFSNRADLEDLAARGFVVLAPDSNGNGTLWPVWDSMHEPGGDDPEGNPDLQLFDELLACAGAHLEIDKNRLYIGGHSAGGIMSNYVLQRRSEILAGGIVASGVFSLTSPASEAALDEMFVIVTWGGDNDEYSGGSGGVSVPSINFVEQASIASVAYDAEPAVSQVHCRGDNVGHAWLDPLNDWFVDTLLAHPKGLAQKGSTTLADLPANPGASCSVEPYVFVSDLLVECPTTSAVEGCADICQFMGDCAVENATVGPILAPQLESLGFSGEDNQECGGCITHCEGVAVSNADDEVLACLAAERESSVCGPGVDGALPVIDALNLCCEGRDDSAWCVDTCNILWANSAARSLLESCEPLVDQ